MCADAVKWSRVDDLAASAAWLETNPELKAKLCGRWVAVASAVGTLGALGAGKGILPAIAVGLGAASLIQAYSGLTIRFARSQSIARLGNLGHEWINEANRRGMDADALKEVFRPRLSARFEHYSPQD